MIKHAWGFLKKWWPSILTILLAFVASIFVVCWGHKDLESYNPRPRDEIIRNYGLLIAAFWAAVFAVWRGQIANQQAESASRQTEIANEQANIALQQSKTSRRGLRNERFQKGADMLGNKTVAVRVGGIYALGLLAEDHPEDYLDQVIKILAAFVRYPVRDEEIGEPARPDEIISPFFREDVWIAANIISNLNDNSFKHDRPDLSGSNLNNMHFINVNFANMVLADAQFVNADLAFANLTGADLSNANFTDANLFKVSFTSSKLYGANLTNARFNTTILAGAYITRARLIDPNRRGTDFTNAIFFGTNISGAYFANVTGLSQEQLNGACQSPDNPPKNLPLGLDWDEEAAIERWVAMERRKQKGNNNRPTSA